MSEQVDYSARVLVSGKSELEAPDYLEHKENGQQKDYVVLTPEERAKGFVRPVRTTYRHLKCGTTTTMGIAIAETYARCPNFYSGTFCCACGVHRALEEFVWEGTGEKVGS